MMAVHKEICKFIKINKSNKSSLGLKFKRIYLKLINRSSRFDEKNNRADWASKNGLYQKSCDVRIITKTLWKQDTVFKMGN